MHRADAGRHSRLWVAAVAVAVLVAAGVLGLTRLGDGGAAPAQGTTATVQAHAPIVPRVLPTRATSSSTRRASLHATVGAVLTRASDGSLTQTCSGVVVDSTDGDVVVTAAHCLQGSGGLDFAPGYLPGHAPYGVWPVRSAYTDAAWQDHSDVDDDYAFLSVDPAPHATRSLEGTVGGLPIGLSPLVGDTVTVRGYPMELGGRPITCRTQVRTTREFPTVDCAGFAAGTSGGPLIAGYDRATGGGTVVGVIGGLETGGCTDDVSYASPFTSVTQAVLAAAEQHRPNSPAPRSSPGSGC